MFAAAKTLHIFAVALSIGLFGVRAVWMIARSPCLQRGWVRILPHIIDTVLFLSGISLVALTGRYPLPAWLAAKLVAVGLYIIFGSLALRRAPTRALRLVSLVAALVAASYVVLAALTRSALLGVV